METFSFTSKLIPHSDGFLSPPNLKPPKGLAAVGVHMLLILSPIVPSGGLIDDALTNSDIISQKKTPAKRGRILVL